MRPLLKETAFFLLFIIILAPASAQSVTYSEIDEIIANPERGFYHHTEVHTGNYNNLDINTLQQYRENEAITQILRVFYLEEFRKKPISAEYLDNMRKDFSAARQAGIKVIIRFAYARSMTAPYKDATPEVVFMHIKQLKPVLRENADVIAVVQAGFIGAWGEWYYTDHFAGASPGNVTEEDWAERQKVVEGLLDALPTDRMVQIRTPGYKMIIFDTKEPLTANEAFSGTNYSRVGHHNDCFVASSSDFGTYVNPDVEKPYLEQETTFLPMGGETCAVAPPYSDCDFATEELERFHWSYLNRDYNREVLNEWADQGCFDEVELRLGYRFKLLSATMTTESKPGGSVDLNIKMINDGYSSPYNPRNVEVVLKNIETEDEFYLNTSEDPRLWPVKEEFEMRITAGLPEEMPEGNYQLFLNLPDPYPLLYGNPAYSIRFANENVWNEKLGYNDLQAAVDVSSDNASEVYSGQHFYGPRSTSNIIEVEGSETIFGSSDESSAVIFWGRQSGYQRVIERSSDGNEFEIVAAISGELDFYKDTDVEPGVTYSYRYYLAQGVNRTGYSNTVDLSLQTEGLPQITIDARDEDWKAITPLSSAVNDTTFSLRAYFDAENANFIFNGPVDHYQIFLNTDNDLQTGESGMDYLIREDSLFTFSSNEWIFTHEKAETASDDQLLEIAISHTLLENLGYNPRIGLYALVNEAVLLAETDGSPSTFVRMPPPDLPASFTVDNSETLNESRLVLEWEECHYCEGYRLERSTDGIEFQEIGDVDAFVTSKNDDGLTNEQTYYYRLSTYNALGISTYSEVIEGTVGQGASPLSLNDPGLSAIYPNPSDDYLIIGFQTQKIEVYNLQGEVILTESGKNKIDISSFSKGIYLLRGYTDDNEIKSIKFIKQ